MAWWLPNNYVKQEGVFYRLLKVRRVVLKYLSILIKIVKEQRLFKIHPLHHTHYCLVNNQLQRTDKLNNVRLWAQLSPGLQLDSPKGSSTRDLLRQPNATKKFTHNLVKYPTLLFKTWFTLSTSVWSG